MTAAIHVNISFYQTHGHILLVCLIFFLHYMKKGKKKDYSFTETTVL